MFKRYFPVFLFLVCLGVMFGASLALAQTGSPSPTPVPVVPDQDVNSLVSQIFAAFGAGKLAVGIAGIVVLCTYFFRKWFVDAGKIGSGILPYVSLGLGAIFGIASNVLFGASPAAAASAVLLSGPIASQIWSAVLKLVLKKAV